MRCRALSRISPGWLEKRFRGRERYHPVVAHRQDASAVFFREIKERGLVKKPSRFSVYVDSPLACRHADLRRGKLAGYLDEETIEVIKSGKRYLSFDGLRISEASRRFKKPSI
jgi:hypothetical protein